MLFKSDALCLQQPIWVHCRCHLLVYQTRPLPSMTSVRVSNVAFLTGMYSRKIASGILGTIVFLNTAWSDIVDNVINLSYLPTALLEQKRFIFSVLEQKVLPI
jgi:hypothetical protein